MLKFIVIIIRHMKIALLVPSRERIDLKKRIIQSLLSTTNSPDNFTLYFGVDDDDPQRDLAIDLSRQYNFVKVVGIHNNGKFIGLGKIWNILARTSTEEIISMIGDDMEFKSRDWDIKIIEEFTGDNLPKDKIKMVFANDLHWGANLATNHFLHRKYMDINGYYTREEFQSWGVDPWIHQVFSSMGRVKYRGDIIIEHKQFNLGKAGKEPDSVTKKMSANGYGGRQEIWNRTVSERLAEVRRFHYYLGIAYDPNKIRK